MSEETLLPDETVLSSIDRFESQNINLELTGETAQRQLMEAEQSVAEEWQVGDVILDTYEVKEIFTGGAMGLVYRVYHRNWNVDLIVKAPRAKYFQTENHKENFKREAETWINLGLYPHTVSCYYVRDLGGVPRVFAEFVEGGTLKDWIGSNGQGRLYEGGKEKALERILDIAIQFAWGLHYAHEKGLVHQDVKPGNVMISSEGLVKVTDFGLAKARGETSQLNPAMISADGSILVESGGMTPAYASPEQASSQSLSRKTDIWSWALSVLEMFTGEMTWMQGEVAAEVLEDYLEDDSEYKQIPKMQEEVAELLKKCFSGNPVQRPKDMLAVGEKLQEIYQQTTGINYARKFPKEVKSLADSLNNKAVSMMDLGRKDEALKLWNQALDVQFGHSEATFNNYLTLWRDGAITFETFLTAMVPVLESHKDDWTSKYLFALTYLEQNNYKAAANELNDIIITNENQAEISSVLQRANDLTRQTLITEFEEFKHDDDEQRIRGLCINRDGNLALTFDQHITFRLWDIKTGRCLRTFNNEERFLNFPQFHSQGGNKLSMNRNGKFAVSFMPQEPDSLDRFKGFTQKQFDKLIDQEIYPRVKLWDVTSGKCLRIFEHVKHRKGEQAEITYSTAISDDGSFVASGTSGSIKLWNSSTGRLLWAKNGSFADCVFNASGNEILAACENEVLLIDVKTGTIIKTFYGHEKPVTSVCFSFDEKNLLSADGERTLKFWEIESGKCLQTLPKNQRLFSEQDAMFTNSPTLVSLSMNNQYAMCGWGVGDYKIWEMETGKTFSIPIVGSTLYGVAKFLPEDSHAVLSDGHRLFTKKLAVAVDSFQANYAISRIQISEKAVAAENEYKELVEQAASALENKNLSRAIQLIKKARSLPGHSQAPEAFKLWVKLYKILPKKSVRDIWKYSPDILLASEIENEIGVFQTVEWWDSNKEPTIETSLAIKYHELPNFKNIKHDKKFAAVKRGASLALVSSNGEYLLDASDNVIKLYDSRSGRLLNTFDEHETEIVRLNFSWNSRFVVSGDSQGIIKLWEIDRSRSIQTFTGISGQISDVSVAHYGRYVLSSSLLPPGVQDYSVKLWDTESGYCVQAFELNSNAQEHISAAMSADGRAVYTYKDNENGDSVITVWDVVTGKSVEMQLIFPHLLKNFLPRSISFDGNFIVLPPLNIHNLKTGDKLYSQRFRATGNEEILFNDVGSCVIADETAWMIDWELEEREFSDWDETARPYLAYFLESYAGRDWQLGFEDLIKLLSFSGFGWLRPDGVRSELKKMAASTHKVKPEIKPDADYISLTAKSSVKGKSALWPVLAVALAVIVAGYLIYNNFIKNQDPRPKNVFTLQNLDAKNLIISKDNSTLYFATQSSSPTQNNDTGKEKPIFILDIKTGTVIHELKSSSGTKTFALSNDNNYLVSESENEIMLWNTKNGSQIWRKGFSISKTQKSKHSNLSDYKISRVGFSPNGNETIVMTSWDNSLNILNTANGELIKIVTKDEKEYANYQNFVPISPDSKDSFLRQKYTLIDGSSGSYNYLGLEDKGTGLVLRFERPDCATSNELLSTDSKYLIAECSKRDSTSILIYELKENQ